MIPPTRLKSRKINFRTQVDSFIIRGPAAVGDSFFYKGCQWSIDKILRIDALLGEHSAMFTEVVANVVWMKP